MVPEDDSGYSSSSSFAVVLDDDDDDGGDEDAKQPSCFYAVMRACFTILTRIVLYSLIAFLVCILVPPPISLAVVVMAWIVICEIVEYRPWV